MKCLLLVFLLFTSIQVYGQGITKLNYADPGETIKPNDVIIYGNFLPRLRPSSRCGAQQFVKIRNVNTKEFFYFETLPHFAANKPHIFCFHLKPGTYEIVQYKWGESFWYGAKFHTEAVIKNTKADSTKAMKNKNEYVKTDSSKFFQFKVSSGKLYYLGTWNFSKEQISIKSNKKQDDESAKKRFFILNFDEATILLPD